MRPSVEKVLTICSNGSGPLNNVVAGPILQVFFSRIKKALRLNIDIKHRGLKVYKVCSNDGRRLTFNLLTAKSNLLPHTFVWENGEKLFFSICTED